MKVKELPSSLVSSLKLLRTPINNLGLNAQDCNPKVIISLTSIPYRIPRLNLVVRSLLDQNISFNKIILWLHVSLKGKLPRRLTSLQSERFEIMYSPLDSPHLKLVETLRVYPNHHIVTCDDDLMYPKDWLKRLLDTHNKQPKAIVAHVCRVIKYSSCKLQPYKSWLHETSGQESAMTLALGVGGVLYPPNSLHEDVTKESLYDMLSPKNDDLWFKAMSLLKGTLVLKTKQSQPEPIPIMFTQKYSLKRDNILRDKNKEQWIKIAEFYNIKHLLDESNQR